MQISSQMMNDRESPKQAKDTKIITSFCRSKLEKFSKASSNYKKLAKRNRQLEWNTTEDNDLRVTFCRLNYSLTLNGTFRMHNMHH